MSDRDEFGPGDAEASSSTPGPGAEPPLRTRAGLAWVWICVAAVVAVALVLFIAQNTQTAHVSFLWLDGSTSVALVMLVSAVAGAVVTAVVGTARILQLRHAVKRQR
jgi:uncharacterized integral membrane protein